VPRPLCLDRGSLEIIFTITLRTSSTLDFNGSSIYSAILSSKQQLKIK